jgi:hypothetical protein
LLIHPRSPVPRVFPKYLALRDLAM